jgi:hypothetical protein
MTMDASTAAFWQVALSVLNLVILTATFVTLVFYTKYTYDMQNAVREQARIAADQTEELIHQRRLSVLPSFVAAPFEDKSSNRIHLNNVGKGVALNVVIRDVPVGHESYPEARIVFPPMPFIQPGDNVHPGLNYAGLGDRTEQTQAMNSSPVQNFLNHEHYILTVRFLDIEGNHYEQALTMSHGKCTPSPVKLASNTPLQPPSGAQRL